MIPWKATDTFHIESREPTKKYRNSRMDNKDPSANRVTKGMMAQKTLSRCVGFQLQNCLSFLLLFTLLSCSYPASVDQTLPKDSFHLALHVHTSVHSFFFKLRSWPKNKKCPCLHVWQGWIVRLVRFTHSTDVLKNCPDTDIAWTLEGFWRQDDCFLCFFEGDRAKFLAWATGHLGLPG